MATVKLGKDFRLKVSDGGGTPAFVTIGGEGTLSFNGSSDKIDISSKDDGQTKSVAFGQSEYSIDLAGVLSLPDIGIGFLDTAAKAGVPIDIKIMVGATAKYAASVYVGNRKIDFSNNQAVKYSFTLSSNGAPSTDSLFA